MTSTPSLYLNQDDPAGAQERRWGPRRILYPSVSPVVALMATAGLLAVRVAFADTNDQSPTVDLEIAQELATYIFVFGFTALVFAVCGFCVGRAEDCLRAQSITDPLTGLTNRRYLNSRLGAEISRNSRTGTPLALMLVDVDRLKLINDSQGHGAGDVALQAVAKCLKEVCRSTDVVARTGGDEFTVLTPGTTAVQAVELANRLRSNLAKHSIGQIPLSVSIGVADLAQVASKQPDALVWAADMALYEAKNGGRDQVYVSKPNRGQTWSPVRTLAAMERTAMPANSPSAPPPPAGMDKGATL